MTDKVLTLHPTPQQNDIVAGLRNLADKIEAGTVEDMPVITTVVCLLGHTESKLETNGDIGRYLDYAEYAWGPRCDTFSVVGLMAYAITQRG
jgi:hypothetical protein